MKSATHTLISTFGGLVGLIGVEHGLGEILQGSVRPGGLMILSWPDSEFFRILGGEPAMTVVPNLLVTGILAVLVSLAFLAASVWFVQRKGTGLALLLLTVPMLLLGGGIFPPVLGVLIGAAAAGLNAAPGGRRMRFAPGPRRFLQALWPWAFGTCLIAWLAMLPGVPTLDYFFGVRSDALFYTILGCMFMFLILAGASAFARDLNSADRF
jgi:hypothetical protein